MRMQFSIEGECVPKKRVKFNRYTGTAYTPKETVDYERLVGDEFVKQLPVGYTGLPLFTEDEPVTIHIVIGIPIPKSYTKKLRQQIEEGKFFPTKKPDIDNCIKSILDGLNGYAFADDKQVCSITATKTFMVEPKTVVWIEDWNTFEEEDDAN